MRFKFRYAIFGIGAYLYLLVTLASVEKTLPVLFAAYAAVCMLLAKSFITGAERRKTKNIVEFYQTGAPESIGVPFGSFHHIFYSNESVIEAYHSALNSALKIKANCQALQEIAFRDVDRDIGSVETRIFFIATAAETIRKSGFSLICDFTRSSGLQSVRWWVLVSGFCDINKLFIRYILAPFSVPFTIIPYIRRRYNPLSGLMTIYPGFFNSIDVLNRTREVQFVAFETLVEVLESFGIDTSNLKEQKSNILNINVTGGQASLGSVVQGAMNKVTGIVGGKKNE